jgi:hypothetical protein
MKDNDRMNRDHDSDASRSNDPSRSLEPSHASHDLVQVAALAADDLEGTERTAIEAIVARCSPCRLLFDDLRSIAHATAALPAVPRTRDFRISHEDAARLRPVGWRRFLAAFSGARLGIPRSVAIGLTTVGVAGLVFSAIPTGGLAGLGSSVAAPFGFGQDSGRSPLTAVGAAVGTPGGTFIAPGVVAQGPAAASAAPSAAASAAVAPPALLPTPVPGGPTAGPAGGGTTGSSTPAPTNATTKNDVSPGPSQPDTAVTGAGPGASDRSAPAPGIGAGVPGVPEAGGTWGSGGGPSPLAIGSAICLLVGLGLLLARRVGRSSSRI